MQDRYVGPLRYKSPRSQWQEVPNNKQPDVAAPPSQLVSEIKQNLVDRQQEASHRERALAPHRKRRGEGAELKVSAFCGRTLPLRSNSSLDSARLQLLNIVLVAHSAIRHDWDFVHALPVHAFLNCNFPHNSRC